MIRLLGRRAPAERNAGAGAPCAAGEPGSREVAGPLEEPLKQPGSEKNKVTRRHNFMKYEEVCLKGIIRKYQEVIFLFPRNMLSQNLFAASKYLAGRL